MIKGIDSILLSSEKAKNLAHFYQDKVGLKINLEAEIGEKGEELYGFEMKSGSAFYIADHSKVTGKNKEPERMILNLEVEDIEKEVKKLDEAGVKKIKDVYHMQGYGLMATFEDLDGNYFQLVQVRESGNVF